MFESSKKHHFVYRITNQLNNKIYIGVHSTDDVEDGYMGSGSLLRREMKEYGVSNFSLEIIHNCKSRAEALKKESALVDYEFISREDTYNLILGGGRGVKTVKSKAIHFQDKRLVQNELANLIKERCKLSPDVRYIFKLKKPIVLHIPKRDIGGLFAIAQKSANKVLDAITRMYNDTNTHAQSVEYISALMEYKQFNGNMYIIEAKR